MIITHIKSIWDRITSWFRSTETLASDDHNPFAYVQNGSNIALKGWVDSEPRGDDIYRFLELLPRNIEYTFTHNGVIFCKALMYSGDSSAPNLGLAIIPYISTSDKENSRASNLIGEWALDASKNGYMIMYLYNGYSVSGLVEIKKLRSNADYASSFPLLPIRRLRGSISMYATAVLFVGGNVPECDLEATLAIQNASYISPLAPMVVYGLNKNGTTKSVYSLTNKQVRVDPLSYHSQVDLLKASKVGD